MRRRCSGGAWEIFNLAFESWKRRDRQKYMEKRARNDVPAVSEADIAKYVDRVRAELIGKEIYKAIRKSPLITRCDFESNDQPGQPGRMAPFPNISFILRTGSDKKRCGYFRSSMRYLFSKPHASEIVEHMSRQYASLPGWDPDGRDRCRHYAEGRCGVPDMGPCIYRDDFAAAGSRTTAEWEMKVFDLLNAPVGPHTRLNADTAFASGVLDFSDDHDVVGTRRLRVEDGNPSDLQRFRLLSCLAHQLQNTPPRKLIFPILLAGTPWITVTTALPGGGKEQVSPSAWMTAFHFVNSLLRSRVIERLRRKAKELYLTLLTEEFLRIHRQHFQKWNYSNLPVMVKELNVTFTRLACVFPYRQIQLAFFRKDLPHPKKKIEIREITLMWGEVLYCWQIANPYFERVLKLQFLSTGRVAGILQDVVPRERKRLEDLDRFAVRDPFPPPEPPEH